jgi:hypothetical protein
MTKILFLMYNRYDVKSNDLGKIFMFLFFSSGICQHGGNEHMRNAVFWRTSAEAINCSARCFLSVFCKRQLFLSLFVIY